MNHHGSINRAYRLVWSDARNAWVPIAENAAGRGKAGRAGASLVASVLSLAWMPMAQAGPSGGQVASGKANISVSGSTTTVQQSGQFLAINWQSFNIAPQETVSFLQPSSSAIAVNRITGGVGSQIFGHLNANGQVWLINPDGVVFGRGAQVNVGGLVASALNVSDTDVVGSKSFSGTGTGDIVNEGSINAASGGYVALLGNRVSNQGTISARLGTVALGAGSAVTLTFESDSLVRMRVDESTLNSLTANGGLIHADGGRVLLSAGAQQAVLTSVVNNTGVIEARTVESHEGTITLLGGMTAGTVTVGGTLDASAPDGGHGGYIETSAARVEVESAAKVTTASPNGLYGSWLVDPTDFTVAANGGDITGAALGGELATTNVALASSSGASPVTGGGSGGNVNVNDAVSWNANTKLTLTAANNVNVNSAVNGTGSTAGVVVNPNTANGTEPASGDGVLIIGSNGSINLTGPKASFAIANRGYVLTPGATINLPNVSPISTTAFTVEGVPVHVINTLGAAGSMTRTDLQGINGNLSGLFALGSNIDASATSSWNGGAGFTPIGTRTSPFTGTFDGLGHTITNLVVNRPSTNNVGLFGVVSSSTTLHNVGLVGGSVTGANDVGPLVGTDNAGKIDNSYSTGTVSGNSYVGGLVGNMPVTYSSSQNGPGGSITNSHAAGAVKGTGDNIGGLVGSMPMSYTSYRLPIEPGSSISNSYATGSVTSSGDNVGGLVGSMPVSNSTDGYAYGLGGSITNSYATGNVTGRSSVGGLIGSMPITFGEIGLALSPGNTISNSYATGIVKGSSTDVGGLVGMMGYGQINNSYATGAISGSGIVGGLLGLCIGCEVSTSYASGSVTGSSSYGDIGGLVGAMYLPPIGSYGGFAGKITDSYATGNVNGGSSSGSVGGLVGFAEGSITNTYATGTVMGGGGVGGLAGSLGDGSIYKSYATGAVTGSTYVGGLVGYVGTGFYVPASIVNSYATGRVNGNSMVGGLVGASGNYGGPSTRYDVIETSYATGDVSGISQVGGLVGMNMNPMATSYATGAVSGTSATGGLVGANTGIVTTSFWNTTTSGQSASAGGLGLTTAQMQMQANFTSATSANGNVNPNWDFTNTWIMYEGLTYPLLQSFMTPLTVTANAATTTYNGGAYSGGNGVSYSVMPDSNLLGTVSYSGSSQGAVNVGTYTITPGGLYSNQQGYIISYASNPLNIAQLASVAWTGGATGNWSASGNWAGGAIPDLSNVAAVTIPKGTTVTYDAGVIGPTSLTSLADGGKLVMAAGDLSMSGNLTTAGFQQKGGALDVGGTLSITSTAGSVILGDIDASALSITSKAGSIAQLANTAIDISGITSLTASNGLTGARAARYAITLAQVDDTFGAPVKATGSTITLDDDTALTATLNSTDATSLTSAGAMSLSGTIGTTLTTATTGANSATTFGVTTVGTSLMVTSTGEVSETAANVLKVAGEGTTNVSNPNVTVNGVKGAKIPGP